MRIRSAIQVCCSAAQSRGRREIEELGIHRTESHSIKVSGFDKSISAGKIWYNNLSRNDVNMVSTSEQGMPLVT